MPKAKKKKASAPKLPPIYDWRTSDGDELEKRRQRAREESFHIANAAPAHPIFSNFRAPGDLPLFKTFVENATAPWKTVVDRLEPLLSAANSVEH